MGQPGTEDSEAPEEQRPDGDVTLDGLRQRSKRLLAKALEDPDWSVRFKAIRLILGKGDVFDEAENETAAKRRRLAEKAEEALKGK